jgi:basic membrane protein A and related proteins
MKKVLLIGLMLIIASGMAMAGGGQEEAEEGEYSDIMIGMATDVGGLGDKSFNDGAWAGIQQAEEEYGVQSRLIESNQMTDYIPNLTGLAEDGATLVFAVGFLMTEAMIEAAGNYPETKYAGIDIDVSTVDAPSNVLGITYKEEQAGYLAGIIAGYMTKKYASESPKLNEENVVGVVLGMDIPPVERYLVGFYQGVKKVNPECQVLSAVTGTFEDQAKGKEAAIAMIEQGADIVFPIAGLTGVGTIEACKERDVLAIGVDVDQNYLAPDTILTSATKGITESTFTTITEVLEGTFEGGRTKDFGIKQDAVGIAPFHSFESIVPKEVKDAVNQTIADMKADEIEIAKTRLEAGMISE